MSSSSVKSILTLFLAPFFLFPKTDFIFFPSSASSISKYWFLSFMQSKKLHVTDRALGAENKWRLTLLSSPKSIVERACTGQDQRAFWRADLRRTYVGQDGRACDQDR
ncbi:hypothetical protein QN277_026126 [Acacia crassicarpa]|uniref:Secreted protein n=1 Tax=Acacia crassicarpa TaxID=499986 RepID=A0AAE1J791_9FABA|nr:hypothetical protein QN277_026126 [Acacia crassicarpa]